MTPVNGGSENQRARNTLAPKDTRGAMNIGN